VGGSHDSEEGILVEFGIPSFAGVRLCFVEESLDLGEDMLLVVEGSLDLVEDMLLVVEGSLVVESLFLVEQTLLAVVGIFPPALGSL